MAQHYGRKNSIGIGEIKDALKLKLATGKSYLFLSQSFFSRLLSHQALSRERTSFSYPWSLGE